MAVYVINQTRRTPQETIDRNCGIVFGIILEPRRFEDLRLQFEEEWGADVETPLRNNNRVEAARTSDALKWKASRAVAERNIEGARGILGKALEFESIDGDTYDDRMAQLGEAEQMIQDDSKGASDVAVRIHRVTLGEFYAKKARDEAEARRQAEAQANRKQQKSARHTVNVVNTREANRERSARQKGKVGAA